MRFSAGVLLRRFQEDTRLTAHQFHSWVLFENSVDSLRATKGAQVKVPVLRLGVRVVCLSMVLIIILFSARTSFAQAGLATLSGSVTDPGGAVIAGARVTATAVPASAEVSQAVSDSDGHFVVKVHPGEY